MTQINIPEPVQAYQLPNGSFVTTKEEYVAKMFEAEAEEEAGVFVFSNRDGFARGQDTRAFNLIKEFISWKSAAISMGTYEEAVSKYREALAAEEAAKKAAKEAAKQSDAPSVPGIPEVPEVPVLEDAA